MLFPALLDRPENLLFSSQDLDEVRLTVARIMRPHALKLDNNADRLEARMYHMALGDLSLSRLSYGASITIEPEPHETFFLVTMPVRGKANFEHGGQQVVLNPGVAAVLSPDDATRMHWHSGNEQLILRLSRALVERTLVGHIGQRLAQPLRFDLAFHWRNAGPWPLLLQYLAECMNHRQVMQQKLVLDQIEHMVAATLLATQRHNYSCFTIPKAPGVLPRQIKRAQEYMQAHAHEHLTAEILAKEVGISVRSIQAGFKEFLGCSPSRYLRDLRLDRVRAELIKGAEGNVAAVALRWGFEHLGRFSSYYKERFGELPRQTLLRYH